MRAIPSLRLPAFVLVVVAAFASPAFAAPATYTGEAPVTSQSEGERAEALKTALAGVVTRLSGDPGLLARSDVAQAVATAAKDVLQYQYRRDVVNDPGAPPRAALTLVAEFDSAAVDAMMARLGVLGAGPAATIDGTPGESRLWISGIRSAGDYARVVGYLSRHALLRGVQPQEARGDGLLVQVRTSAGLHAFLDLVAGEGVLRVASASPPVDGIDATLMLSP
ncbi:DUF2066 domain-containing protein [Dokdonella sp. MW10]|uniref:DUF2066 domain-containing protein n=1 Tax=Dokdonella sp. MW10 TaxID=2992926 RepID=UPI003F7E9A5E